MIEQKNTNELILKNQIIYQSKSKQVLQKTLQFSGLKLGQQIDYRSVKIYDIDHIHEIYTKNQDSNLPHLVLLHGFGGTGMTFYRIFKPLMKYFKVHALDAMGVGHSSKGVFKSNFTYQQTRNYFIDAIQKWRTALNIQHFTLAGHSFGGYIAACYTQAYANRVDRLILLSPAGMTEQTPQQVQQQIKKQNQRRSSLKSKFFYYFAQKIYNLKLRPSKIMGSYFIGNRFIDKIVGSRLKLQDQQGQAWKTYFRDLSEKDAVGQIGFYIIFQWPFKTKHTIQSMIKRMEFKKPIQFYYGQYDWMDSVGARRLSNKFQNVKFNKITGADHQLIFDNPKQVSDYIISRRLVK